MKIIGFYTPNTPYEEEAYMAKLLLDNFQLPYHFYEVDNKKDWALNCAQKSKVIRQALEDFEEDILYLDVDSRVIRKPPFEEINRGLPAYCIWYNPLNGAQLASGTIYFPNNNISRQVVDAWIEEQERNPTEWDQQTLQNVYEKYPHTLLSHDWINIQGYGDVKFIETETPIVVHTQASRRHKKSL